MTSAIADVLRTLEEQLHPSHTALLVVDMQNDFCAQGGYLERTRAAARVNAILVDRNVAIAERIARLAERVRAMGVPVIWLRSIYDYKYLAAAHIARRESEGCCMEGQWGADWFHIAPEPGETVIDKHTFNGFHDTGLDETLRAMGIRTLVFTGVATNVCVETTLRDAFVRGYNVVLVEDCVGSGNQTGHEGTLSTVRVNFGHVAPSDLIARTLDAAASSVLHE